MSLTVAELREWLETFDDDMEVFYKIQHPIIRTIGEIFWVSQDTYGFFGVEKPCVMLSADEPTNETARMRQAGDGIVQYRKERER